MTPCAHLVRLLAACLIGGAPAGASETSDGVSLAGPPVQIEFASARNHLAGELYLPNATGAVAGVVILGGSERGPRTDMKRRLAAHFAGAGVAALIYDSPGTGRSAGNALLQTRDQRADEALAALGYLAAHDRVRSDRVGIAGISEGALVTLLAAAKSEDVAFAIPISGGFGSSITELARYRIETKGRLRELPPDGIQRALLLEEVLFALFAGPERTEWRLVELKAAQWPDEPWGPLIDAVRSAREAASENQQRAVWEAIRGALGAWRGEQWWDLVVVDPGRFDRLLAMTTEQFYAFLEANPLGAGDIDKVARELIEYPKIRCPVLAVWGENDEFLPPHTSAAFLRSVLAAANHNDATFLIVPDASHILTAPDDDAAFAAGYPAILTEWLAARFGPLAP